MKTLQARQVLSLAHPLRFRKITLRSPCGKSRGAGSVEIGKKMDVANNTLGQSKRSVRVRSYFPQLCSVM